MKHNLLKSLIISVILLMGVSNAWGDDTRQFLIGDATGGNWTENKFTYPVDSYYGQDNKCCIYVWMQNGQHFAFCNYTGSQYGPASNEQEIKNGDSSQEGNYEEGKFNAWKYTGNTGLVRICVDYSYKNNVWRPCVWVEELTEVMKGNEIMFYFGDTWNWGVKYLKTNSSTPFEGKAGFERLDSKQTYSTCCKVPTGKYYISDKSEWLGKQMSADAEAGAMYSLTNNNGNNVINVIQGVKPTWTSDKTTFKVYKGTRDSGIAATCGNSVINKPNTIYYCYTQDNQNFYRFNPDDVSNLPLGTYTVWAIACDGHIAVRSATSVELQIKNCTVNYMESHGGKITVTYTDQNGDTQTKELRPDQPFDITTGGILNFTAQANEGYTFQGIYVKRPNHVYTNNLSDTVIINSNITIIPEFTHNSNKKIVFLDLNTKLPVSDPNTSDENRYWTKGNAYFKVHYDGSDYDIQDWDINNKLYYHNQHVAAGKVLIFKRYGNDDKLKNSSPTIVTADDLNKYAIIGKAPASWTEGEWREGPTRNVYVDPCFYGKFGIRAPYQPDFTMCRKSEDMSEYETVIVPYGTEIEITDVVISPEYTSHYTKNPRYKYSVAVQVLTAGYPFYELTELKYTVTEDMYVCPNIVMAQPHTVYLHIPEGFIDDWNGADEFKYNTMYLTDYLSGGQIILENQNNKRVAHLLTATKDNILSSRGEGEYWKFEVPAGYNAFIIERKTNGDDDDWGEGKNGHRLCSATPNFYFRSPVDIKNVYSLTRKTGGTSWIGEWKEAPKYTVQLGYCEFGEYSVMCNGNIYTSTPNQNVSFEAPYGSEITFVEGTPLQDIYKGGWMLRKFNGSDKETRLDVTEPYYVTGDILLDDNFVTRNERVFYFAVPTTKNSDTQWDNAVDKWNKTIDSKKAEYYIWTRDDVGYFDMLGDKCHGHPMQSYGTKNGYKYYKFTLPAERNQFRFEHKVPNEEDTTINNGNETLARTHYLKFQVPTTEKNCYYLTGEYTTSNEIDYYNGYWDILPIDDDQYRLLYVEQVVEKDKENNTVLTRKKAHPSDIFTIGDITSEGKKLSLHVYRDRSYEGIAIYDEEGPKYDKKHKYYTTQASNAGVILQKTEGGKWVDISNNMVFGPLEAVPEVALLPGRKNAAKSNSSTNFDYLYYDDGIENIKKDEHPDKGKHPDEGNGVWNFVVKKNNQGEVYIALDETHRYEGDYYIRTVAAEGGWNNYTRVDGNGQKTNLMTRSDISKVHSNYSHYFCKWIGQAGTDVQFTVANDYGCAISDTLMSDRTDLQGIRTSEAEKIVRGLTLPQKASVRFSWNEKTNFIHRAYLGGSTDVHERFLVLKGSGDDKLYNLNGQQLPKGQDNGSDPRYGLNTNEEIFNDVSNWVYYADVNMIPKAQVKLTADLQWTEGGKNMEVVQHFIGSADAYCDTILNGSGSQQYHVRMLYDFKTNEIISAYVPGGNTDIEAIETNLMLVRQENNTASQMEFTNNDMQDVGKRSYGVIELSKKSLITDYNAEEDYYRVSLYWISFPFDVAIKDIFGFGKYGTHYVIQSYNGKQRAEKGLWKDSDTNWDYHFNASSLNKGTLDEGIMKKGVGYVLALDRDLIDTEKLFEGRIETIALYFPANTTIQNHIVNGQTESIEVPAHECTINRGTPKGDRRIKDSHWNVIGVPSYADPISSLKNYYRWDGQYDAYTLMSSDNGDAFKTMNAYMVQYKGNLDWSNVVEESRIAAKRNTEAVQEHHLRLELQQNGEIKDYTYITMQDEDVTTGFDFNYDLCKIINKGSNIYSIITNEESPVEVAANVLPIEETIIPLGVVTTTAGEYTFAMPNGTDGIVVELIDYETNTRTNMLLDNYTVNLGKGTFETRFALHVKPDKTVTSVEDINTNSDGVRKFIIDGTLYMQKDGMLYDAQGRCVR